MYEKQDKGEGGSQKYSKLREVVINYGGGGGQLQNGKIAGRTFNMFFFLHIVIK